MDTYPAYLAIQKDLDRYHRTPYHEERERLLIMDRMIDTLCDLDPELDLGGARTKVTELILAERRS